MGGKDNQQEITIRLDDESLVDFLSDYLETSSSLAGSALHGLADYTHDRGATRLTIELPELKKSFYIRFEDGLDAEPTRVTEYRHWLGEERHEDSVVAPGPYPWTAYWRAIVWSNTKDEAVERARQMIAAQMDRAEGV